MKLEDNIVINKNRATAFSYAKINLTLDILGTRDDGYHSIETIMQTVNLSDTVVIDKTYPGNGINIRTNKKYLPVNNKNIAYKATELFFKELDIHDSVNILIHKNIPVAAGLAGGSGNGAAVLAALNLLYSKPFSESELCDLAAKIGADVPYCLLGGTQFAEGIGEILTPVASMPDCYVLMITPPISISTPWVYNEYDNCEKNIFPDNKKMKEALEEKDYYKICTLLSNVFEDVTAEKYPVIRGIKEKLIMNGANGAVMSGSGPTVFGLFDDYKKAKASHDSFSFMYRDVFLTTIRN